MRNSSISNLLNDLPSFSPDEPYYQKDAPTSYRRSIECAHYSVGWELYRRDPSFLSGPPNEKKKIEECFLQIRKAFGDEFSSDKKKNGVAGKWIDGLVLEDDQRAIGETMLEKIHQEWYHSDTAAFCERKAGHPHRDDEVGQYSWQPRLLGSGMQRASSIELSLSDPCKNSSGSKFKKLIKALDDLMFRGLLAPD